jgi:hypothetical protein
MNRHFKYGVYIIRHKYFVLLAGIRLGYWSLLWRLIIHDWSKFTPSEWGPYANYFFGPKENRDHKGFDYAWIHHIHHNKHHWDYWCMVEEDEEGCVRALRMPRKYALEMVFDWMGAGRAITGKWEAKEWYFKNRDNIILHPETRRTVEGILKEDV